MNDRLYPQIDSLHFVVYFESAPEAMDAFLRAAVADILELVGKRRVYLNQLFVDAKGQPYHKKAVIPPSDAFALFETPGKPLEAIKAYAPARRARRYAAYALNESLFQIEYEPRQVSHGRRQGPSLQISVNLEWIDEHNRRKLPETVQRIAQEVVQIPQFEYGFCDIADVRETWMGLLYSGANSNVPSFQRQLNRVLWEQDREQDLCAARGVYWGNILSQKMVGKLGGETWLSAYSNIENFADDKLCWRLNNGCCLVILSARIDEVRSFSAIHSVAPVLRAAALYRRLCETGQMSGVHPSAQGPLCGPFAERP